MKKLICFFLLLSGFTLLAQQKEVHIKWSELRPFSNLDSEQLYPFFDSEHYSLDPVNNKLIFSEVLSENNAVNPNSLKIEHIQFENINVSQLGALKKEYLPETISPQLKMVHSRGQSKSVFSFYPIIREGNFIKRVVSVRYSFQNSLSRGLYGNEAFAVGRQSSILKSGNWFRFTINKTGVYKINKSFLSQLGVPSTVDPRTIKIYGKGATMLPLINAAEYPTDLVETPIQIIGEEDGSFDASDYILFYAIGADQWNDENLTHLNLYEDEISYFLTYDGMEGKRIQKLFQPTVVASKVYAEYDAVVFHEKDLINVGNLGRKWFGERFNVQNRQSFTFQLPNLDSSKLVTIAINAASASYGNTSFTYAVNGVTFGTANFSRLTSQTTKAYETFFSKEVSLSNNQAVVDLVYNNGGVPSSDGYLDYIQLTYTAKLQGFGKQFGFQNATLAFEPGIVEYRISQANEIEQVWDVTNVEQIEGVSNSNNSNLSFKVLGGELRKFHAISSQDFYEPMLVTNSRVMNQDIKTSVFSEGDVDYLLITHPRLKVPAERLARFHRVENGFKVKVVTVDEIYNEFSSGKQDVAAIRNFIRYVYQNGSSDDKRVRFVNLFGEASFDYKNRVPNNKNVVPVFYGMQTNRNVQSSGSNFSAYTTFMSDDFYALMDHGEGLMLDASYGVDLAVGRILANTVDEANAMVDKIEEYHKSENQGRWRNAVVAMADDVDRESDIVLQSELNMIVDDLVVDHPFFNVKKIFLDAYVQESSAGGHRYPTAKKEFIESIENGALYVSYLGHGGEDGLAHERVFGLEDARNLKNQKKYPLFVTITCEFTRFDNPYRLTGGENMFKNKQGGAIALVATTREIGIEPGRRINKQFSKDLFDENGQFPTIAEALVATKNQTFSRDKNVVFFIGDPALKLAIPRPKVVLTHINEKLVHEQENALEALGYVKLKGELQDEHSNLISSFNGDLAVQIYDKNIERKTLGNDGVRRNGTLVIMDFETLGETVFRGNASINQGKFGFDFVLPKDINMAVGKGKVSFYAQDAKTDYTGYNTNITIGGVNKDAPDDKTPPLVQLFMDHEAFVSGGVTTSEPVFLAFLEDENGINTSSGIGHDIVAYLDGDERNAFVLNDYYETETDNFRKGKITFPMKDLEEGLHTLTFKVWDVYNNLTTMDIQFVVAKEAGIKIEKVLNYPNPFVNYTEFWFTHNRPYESLDVQVQIMTIAGRLVKTIRQTVVSEGNLSREISWDGRDDFGDRIGKGVYIYKLTVSSTQTNQRTEKIEKLVIL